MVKGTVWETGRLEPWTGYRAIEQGFGKRGRLNWEFGFREEREEGQEEREAQPVCHDMVKGTIWETGRLEPWTGYRAIEQGFGKRGRLERKFHVGYVS